VARGPCAVDWRRLRGQVRDPSPAGRRQLRAGLQGSSALHGAGGRDQIGYGLMRGHNLSLLAEAQSHSGALAEAHAVLDDAFAALAEDAIIDKLALLISGVTCSPVMATPRPTRASARPSSSRAATAQRCTSCVRPRASRAGLPGAAASQKRGRSSRHSTPSSPRASTRATSSRRRRCSRSCSSGQRADRGDSRGSPTAFASLLLVT
jgi:hypothetical protein